MVPKIHAKGSSFKGAAMYLLHDKDRAETSERVAWAETRNLAVDDPHVAWKIMAATALDQDRLKAQAGVKRTGRKSDKHVLHISLAWHPDQTPERAEMVRAADQAVKAIGGSDRQAMYVAHSDEKHPHIHILINRVSPEDGRHLSSSNDRLKLSKWAEGYERAAGEILCENRVVNNAQRAKGDYVKGPRDIARNVFEALPRAANDNDHKRGVIAQERAKDHALLQRGRDMAARHSTERTGLADAHGAKKAALQRDYARAKARARKEVQAAFQPEWRALNRTQAAERKTFDAMEASFFGRASNMAKTMRMTLADVREPPSRVVSRAFGILTNAGDRRAYFERAQERAQKALEGRQKAKLAAEIKTLKAAHTGRLDGARRKFLDDRSALSEAQAQETKALKADWKDRRAARAKAFADLEQRIAHRGQAKTDHATASKPELTEREKRYLERYDRIKAFKEAADRASQAQDSSRKRDKGGHSR